MMGIIRHDVYIYTYIRFFMKIENKQTIKIGKLKVICTIFQRYSFTGMINCYHYIKKYFLFLYRSSISLSTLFAIENKNITYISISKRVRSLILF